jgi:hypothetical protein
MRGMFRRKDDDLARVLRADAPVPDEDFVASLARAVSAGAPTPRRRRSNVVFAAGLAVVMVGSFASFGALGFAASGAQSAATAARDAVAKRTSADDQYGTTKPLTPPKTGTASAKQSKPRPAQGSAGAGTTLPFTGLSLVGTGILGLALLGTGVALRRREKRE